MQAVKEGMTSCPVYTFDGQRFSRSDIDVIHEVSLQIFFNRRPLATIACTGIHLDELAVGYLKSEGLIRDASDIRDIQIDPESKAVHLTTVAALTPAPTEDLFRGNIASSGARSRFSGGHDDLPTIQDALKMSPHQVLKQMDRFIDLCRLHRVTRGTHGAALTNGREILIVREDIGRHNTIDMLAGYALINACDCSDKAVLRTGRISTEIVYKIWKLGTPIVVSLAAPTTRAIELAGKAGITLIGAIRGTSMQVYTHERRIDL